MATNTIRTFPTLHQMTNYVPIPGMPIPQVAQMMSHPNMAVQNPLVNPLRDISGRNRTIQDVFNDRVQLREEQRKQQEEEIQRRIKEHDGKKKQDKGQTLFDVKTKGTFEPLSLFSPDASMTDDQEEEDPFLNQILKHHHHQKI